VLGAARLPGASMRLPVDRLAAALGVTGPSELRRLVEELRGPIVDRRRARSDELVAREQLWSWFADKVSTLALAPTPATLVPWVEAVRAAGIRGGIEEHRQRLADVLAVLRALPAAAVPLAGLADDVLADPHGLDHGRMCAALVLDAVAAASGRLRSSDAESARLLWESVGVAPDPYSSAVLVLRLRPPGCDPMASWLQALAHAAEPALITLAQLRRWPVPPLPAGSTVYVVENPSLLAAAAESGPDGPVVVCSSGRPTVAVVTLLRQLGSGGAALHQHADFDAAGLSITAWLAERAGTVPWRMNAVDYLAATASPRRRVPIAGTVPDTAWDPPLRAEMAAAGVAVYEEELRTSLVRAMVPTARGRR
jgi:uncharacterized protein (TIGR02679 family)